MEPDDTFTRRLCAVLLADVTGFSKLMGEDDERTARVVRHLQSIAQGIVSDNNGRAEPVAGDALFATFDSVVAAVQAAVAIQRRVADEPFEGQRLQIRIGVHLGDVLLRDGRAFGDAINIAARLEALARPGTICISEGVYRQVRNKFDEAFVDLGAQRLKNISDPVHAYLIVAKEAAPRPTTRRRAMRWAIAAGALVVVAIAGGVAAWRHQRFSVPSAPPPIVHADGRKSVAVLPFVNMSSDKENEYFSDGITEDLITALSKVSGLRVAARTSSFAFKGKNEPIEKIGAQLHVGAVLEGSVAKAGNQVRITAQLINVADGYHLWSDSYDRELKDIFAVRSQVAETVAKALQVTLVAGEHQMLGRKPTEDVEAYQLYLKGRHAAETYADYGTAMRYLRQAIARDPSYALAYLGLAYYYVVSVDFPMSGSECFPRAREAAEKALQLDPSLAEAHTWLGFVYWLYDRDHAAARRELQAALTMQPDLASAHEVKGWYLVATDQVDEGRPRRGAPSSWILCRPRRTPSWASTSTSPAATMKRSNSYAPRSPLTRTIGMRTCGSGARTPAPADLQRHSVSYALRNSSMGVRKSTRPSDVRMRTPGTGPRRPRCSTICANGGTMRSSPLPSWRRCM
jgi:adenylate cyclase